MSLRARVVASAAAVLAVFILLTSLALEQAFRDTAQSAREERLLAQIFLLMAAAEAEGDSLVLPDTLAEARFSLPGSGLYARVFDGEGRVIWESVSAVGVAEPGPMPLAPGEGRLELRTGSDGLSYLVEGFGVSWATGEVPRNYVFVVAEDMIAFNTEVGRFRGSLAVWLGAMAVLMLMALVLILAWGLAPLRRVAAEVAAIESGDQAKILGTYPSEIRALTDNLNALLVHEQARQTRLDNALGDLAHSLKTPLAVIKGAIAEAGSKTATGGENVLMEEQLARMDNIISHQLQRARTGSIRTTALAPPVRVRTVAERLVGSLDKVYRDKGVRTTILIPEEIRISAAEGDLMEMLGNLLDNAFKWCRSEVRIRADVAKGMLILAIEDDGPGIPAQDAQRLLARGARADEAVPGQGIGLAVAREICEAYGGRLGVETSTLGGARLCLHLPM
jgi:two-component system, OmpR family, sensor histidine kinase PhoQ